MKKKISRALCTICFNNNNDDKKKIRLKDAEAGNKTDRCATCWTFSKTQLLDGRLFYSDLLDQHDREKQNSRRGGGEIKQIPDKLACFL